MTTTTLNTVRAGIRLGALKHYLSAYESVFMAYENAGELQTLRAPINTLLAQMLLQRKSAVDILLNDRQPGERAVRINTRAETYAKLS